MEKTTARLSGGPARRVAAVARVGARYGFGFAFGRRFSLRRRPPDLGKIGTRMRLSFEELGPNFAELGYFLSLRRDLLPPDTAVELGRTLRIPKPMSPTEVRTRLETELNNSLERLFVEFSEEPVRVGVFTQSHRVTLPGDRPALVVVNRPGIRRDLLAMRPVADLTRRRLGDRLPLDPGKTVAQFAAHTAHRRDMYAVAQNVARLATLGDLGIRIPEAYRGYSSSRCVTFEAPPDPEPLDAAELQTAAGALTRLGVLEGVFFADVSPERFVRSGEEIWFSDPTESFALDPERMRGISEVLSAVRREDVDGILRALPLTGAMVPFEDATLKRELREALGSLGGPLWREHTVTEVRDAGLEALRRGGVVLEDESVGLFGSLVALEGLSGSGQISAAAGAAGRLNARYRDPAYLIGRTARRLSQPDAYADYPRQIHAFLDELKDGELEVRFQHGGLDELIGKVDLLANRLVFALLIAALIIGSSMLGIFTEGGAKLLGVSVFGLIGFV
ncbi:MAG: AarF/UbiB family protein, partial [Rubrobacteraceae bacterium]